ncbi:sensor histidine kinase [Miltoncostaea marina]|uniref:sensor histidine kinase n=1 Tax=Miltoncostaea marina TaxID=2843215 RepID=UPI001C3CD94B|nr:histidine kinase [Miltoncostaea marina]
MSAGGWSAEQVAEALIRSGELALYLIDGEGRTAFANAEALRLLGYDEPAALIGRPSHETIHYKRPDGAPFPAAECPLLAVRLQGRGDRRDRDWWVRRDGSMLPVSYHAAPISTATGPGVAVMFRDLTATLRAEDERRRHEVEQALLAEVRASRARIVEAADAERRRLVRDIHDGAQQHLVQAVISLQLARGAAGPGDAGPAPLIDEALEATRRATAELRELAAGIHPAILVHRGLAAAVRGVTARSRPPVELDVVEARFPPSVESTAYFVVAEALTNVSKYAEASRARVRVAVEGDDLVVEVRDDGRGGADPARGTGLRGLRDRLEALGGGLAVGDAEPRGTLVRARLPLTPAGGPGPAAT